jgi:hypothetical protein
MKNSIKSQTILVPLRKWSRKEHGQCQLKNHERRQIIPSKVIWDRTIDHFELFRNNVEGNYGQIDAGYVFDSSFQAA